MDVLATRFIPSLRLEGQAGESAAVRVIFSALQEQLSSLNVKEKQLLLFLSLARQVEYLQLMRRNLFSAYDV